MSPRTRFCCLSKIAHPWYLFPPARTSSPASSPPSTASPTPALESTIGAGAACPLARRPTTSPTPRRPPTSAWMPSTATPTSFPCRAPPTAESPLTTAMDRVSVLPLFLFILICIILVIAAAVHREREEAPPATPQALINVHLKHRPTALRPKKLTKNIIGIDANPTRDALFGILLCAIGQGLLAVLVINSALAAVTQHVVHVADFLEHLFCDSFVIGVLVGMPLERLPSVCFLNLVLCAVPVEPHQGVEGRVVDRGARRRGAEAHAPRPSHGVAMLIHIDVFAAASAHHAVADHVRVDLAGRHLVPVLVHIHDITPVAVLLRRR